MFADLSRDSGRDDAADQENHSIQADVGLRDWSRHPKNRRTPAEMESGKKIRDTCYRSGEKAYPGVQPQGEKNNEKKENQYGGTRQWSVCRFNTLAGEKGNREGRD